MRIRTLVIASVLLSVTAAGPAFAGDLAPLPDMSRALQARIDGRMSAVLDGGTGNRHETASEERAGSTGRGTEREASSASGRTDERGWKPYHSAI